MKKEEEERRRKKKKEERRRKLKKEEERRKSIGSVGGWVIILDVTTGVNTDTALKYMHPTKGKIVYATRNFPYPMLQHAKLLFIH